MTWASAVDTLARGRESTVEFTRPDGITCRPARLNTHLLNHAAANDPNRLLVRTRRHNSPHFVYFGTPFIRTIRSSPRSVSSPLAPPHERNGPRHPRAENVEELAPRSRKRGHNHGSHPTLVGRRQSSERPGHWLEGLGEYRVPASGLTRRTIPETRARRLSPVGLQPRENA